MTIQRLEPLRLPCGDEDSASELSVLLTPELSTGCTSGTFKLLLELGDGGLDCGLNCGLDMMGLIFPSQGLIGSGEGGSCWVGDDDVGGVGEGEGEGEGEGDGGEG